MANETATRERRRRLNSGAGDASGGIGGILGRLVEAKVVPVLRSTTPETAAAAADALAEAGFTVFEITLTTPDAPALIGSLARRAGVLVGAGTVTTRADAERCLAAGARFLVSPCVAPEIVAPGHAAGVPVLLGALTPSEVLAARAAEADAVKIFPVSSVGGPAHVKALRSVFPGVPLVPTGGIAAEEVLDYLDAGAAFVGMGGRLVDERLAAAGRTAEIIALGRSLRAALGLAPE